MIAKKWQVNQKLKRKRYTNLKVHYKVQNQGGTSSIGFLVVPSMPG